MEKFKTALAKAIKAETDLSYQFNSVKKNNGVVLESITLGDEKVRPNIYLKHYYQAWKQGEGIVSIAKSIIEMHEKSTADFDESMLDEISPNKILNNVEMRLVNTEANKEFLNDIPHVEFLDMSIIYYRRLNDFATVTITNRIIDDYKITQEELEKNAKFPAAEIKTMHETLIEMTGEELVPPMPELLVVSSENKTFGAIEIADKVVLKEIEKRLGDGFIVIPSSVHEVICLTPEIGEHVEDIKEMVQQVNQTQLQEIDILSNSVYRYSAETESLEIVA